MSKNSKAKNFGPPTAGQKTITQFFTKQPTNSNANGNSNAGSNNRRNEPSSSSSSSSGNQNSNGNRTTTGNKRKHNVVQLPKTGRKVPSSSSTAASTSKGPIEIVDLIDSDDQDERETTNTVNPPAWVMGPQTYTGIKMELMTTNTNDNNNTTATNDDDDYEIPDPFLQSFNQDDNNDTSMNCKIRIVDFNNILETSSTQSSEFEYETQELQLNCSDDSSKNSNNNHHHHGDALTQVVHNGNQVQIPPPSTPTKKSVWEVISPTKKLSTNTTGATSKQRKTPTKSPKSKVTAFSPIKQLNRSRSRSASKTPTKNRTHSSSSQRSLSTHKQQQNGQNKTAVKSPLRALWSNPRPPYYLSNFLTVLNTVVEDSHNSHLLNEDDLDIVEKFRNLSNNAQCLFVRLTNRKFKWEKVSAVKYPAISENLLPIFKELHTNKFLVDLNDEKLSLDQLLDILSQTSIDELCNKLHTTVPGRGRTKEKCKAALLKSAEKQKTLQGNMSDIIYKAAVKEVGPTYKIASAPKNLFSRICILFSPPQYWDNDADQGTNQQLFFLLTEAGKMEFPNYKIIKSTRIYATREEILEFQDAWTLHSDIQAYAESKQWQECCEIAEEAKTLLVDLLKKPERKENDLKLPLFLRAYTAGSLLVRICWLGVDGFQKVRDYTKANEYLNFLLQQDIYLPHYRGQFYERLVINSKHLRITQADVRKIIHKALIDKHTKESHKLDLTTRLEKLKPDKPKSKPKPKPKKKKPKKKPKKKKRVTRSTKNCENSDSDFEAYSDDDDEEDESTSSSSTECDESADNDSEIEYVEIYNVDGFQTFQIKNNLPEVIIEGEKLPMFDREHGKSRFRGDIHGTTPMSTVEGFALQYYQSQGYNHGAHAEGAVISTIYGLLFWDLIYHEEIADVFHSPYQAFPLDLFFDDFRSQRSSKIENLLLRLRFEYTVQDALDIMQVNWTENLNRVSIVSWDLFPRFEDLKILVESMGLPLIAGICDRLSQNYRYYRSGFPDITLWDGRRCKFAEVKGPGDTLSAKQRLWLDYLISLNAPAEVCRVKAVSSKRIRMT